MKRAKIYLLPVLAALAACSQPAGATDRLHPLESLCVDYEQSGMMSGSSTECHRNWAFESYKIEDFTMSIMGMTQRHNQHVVTIGSQITSWDRDTLQGTVTTNPMYDDMVAASDGDIEDFTNNMLSAMGFSETSQTKTIAGESCTVWTSAQMGEMCFTDDAVVLEQSMNMGMGSFVRRATSVRRGDNGDAANYEVPGNVTISTGPDLQSILGGMGN